MKRQQDWRHCLLPELNRKEYRCYEKKKNIIEEQRKKNRTRSGYKFISDRRFEEVYHFEQNLKGLNSDEDALLRGILNEIDAKSICLIMPKYIESLEKRRKTPKDS